MKKLIFAISLFISAISLSLTVSAQKPVSNVSAALDASGNALVSWALPGNSSSFQYCGEEDGGSYSGYPNNALVTVGIRIPKDSLAAKGFTVNSVVSKIRFYRTKNVSYEVAVMQGTTLKNTQEIVNKSVTTPTITGWENVYLDNCPKINMTQDLYIVLKATGYSYNRDYPATFASCPVGTRSLTAGVIWNDTIWADAASLVTGLPANYGFMIGAEILDSSSIAPCDNYEILRGAPTDAFGAYTSLGQVAGTVKEYTDTYVGPLTMGSFKYAVRSIYSGAKQAPTYSNTLTKNVRTNMNIQVKFGTAPVENVYVQIIYKSDTLQTGSGFTNVEGQITFAERPLGDYKIRLKSPLFRHPDTAFVFSHTSATPFVARPQEGMWSPEVSGMNIITIGDRALFTWEAPEGYIPTKLGPNGESTSSPIVELSYLNPNRFDSLTTVASQFINMEAGVMFTRADLAANVGRRIQSITFIPAQASVGEVSYIAKIYRADIANGSSDFVEIYSHVVNAQLAQDGKAKWNTDTLPTPHVIEFGYDYLIAVAMQSPNTSLPIIAVQKGERVNGKNDLVKVEGSWGLLPQGSKFGWAIAAGMSGTGASLKPVNYEIYLDSTTFKGNAYDKYVYTDLQLDRTYKAGIKAVFNTGISRMEQKAFTTNRDSFDVKLTKMVAPNKVSDVRNGNSVKVMLKNIGNKPISNIPLNYRTKKVDIDDWFGTLVTENYSNTLNVGEEVTYTFSKKMTISNKDSANLAFYAFSTFIADIDNSNDTTFYTPVVLKNTKGYDLSSTVKVYPNPSNSGVIYVESPATIVNQLFVRDLAGRVLNSYNAYDNTFAIQTNIYKKGMYIFEMHTRDGVITKKVIIE